METYTLADGDAFVKAARYSIELYLKSPLFDKRMVERSLDRFGEHRGVFVTIYHYPTMILRGCIGFSGAAAPLKAVLVEAAVASATEDPRFVPMSHHEMLESVIEVNVLGPLERINDRSESARMRAIKIRRDGLEVHYGFKRGLLLPAVPVEEGWTKEQFLEEVCGKAGLKKDSWKRPEISLYKFTSQRFQEESPEGTIKEMQFE